MDELTWISTDSLEISEMGKLWHLVGLSDQTIRTCLIGPQDQVRTA